MEISDNHPDPRTVLKMEQKPKSVKQHSEYENMNLKKDANYHTRLPPMIPTEDVYEVPDQVYHVDDSGDQNLMEILDIIHTISLSDLFSYVTSKTAEDYFQEYARFPQGMISSIPYTFSRRPQNAPLNRYQGIYPYDHSRVVIPGEPDFFINANYIDGYSKERAYIASLGPTVRHTLGFQTFWKMVWHEKSDVIVMLTNLQEPSGMKCEKYWADHGTTREVGDFTIQSMSEEVAAEYTVRTLNVTKKGESRLVTQLHYTAWPDKKVPEDVTSLIEFWQRVKAASTRSLGPLIVHCSAGIGRTGTYIALDRLFEEGKTTNTVNVFDCVMSMRQQRVNMVQTQDQYIYLHQALVYCLVFDTNPVTADKIEEYVLTTSHNVYIKLFEQLKQSVEVESTYEAEARTRNCDYDERNRAQADIPGDAHRIRLFLDKESDESDYINAVYLNSFKRLGHFIIAQSPLPKTLDDFVLMLYQENCCCIVSLNDYQQKGTNNAVYLPAENQHATYGTCTISSTMVDSKSAYSVRKLKIGHSSRYEKGMKIAHHFEYTGWKHDERIPKDVNMFVEFVQEVEEYATQLADEHSHVLVHCLTGSGRSGLFCAVSNLIQKMGQERQVSVVNTLRQVRARRQTAIRNTEQLKFCYQSVYAFVKNYKV